MSSSSSSNRSRARPGRPLSLPRPPEVERNGLQVPRKTINWSNPPRSEDPDVSLEHLEILEKIGQGNGGRVHRVRHRITGSIYALKIINSGLDPATIRRTLREMEITRRFCVGAPHIVQCFGVFEQEGGQISLVLELMNRGTLDTLRKKKPIIPEPYLALIFSQVLHGLQYLHSQKIVHRDLKPSNLLLNDSNHVKIADFGVSAQLDHTMAKANTFVGTYAYMSPERLDPDGTYGGRHDTSADIWSLGLVMLECSLGAYPLLQPNQAPDWVTLMVNICRSEIPPPPPTASPEFCDFVKSCLHRDPRLRPSAKDLQHHPFLQKYQHFQGSISDLF